MNITRSLLAALATGALVAASVTACTADPAPPRTPTYTYSDVTGDLGTDRAQFTDLLDMTFGNLSRSDQRDSCTLFEMSPAAAQGAFEDGWGAPLNATEASAFHDYFASVC